MREFFVTMAPFLLFKDSKRKCKMPLDQGSPFALEWDGIIALWSNYNIRERYQLCPDYAKVVDNLREALNDEEQTSTLLVVVRLGERCGVFSPMSMLIVNSARSPQVIFREFSEMSTSANSKHTVPQERHISISMRALEQTVERLGTSSVLDGLGPPPTTVAREVESQDRAAVADRADGLVPLPWGVLQ